MGLGIECFDTVFFVNVKIDGRIVPLNEGFFPVVHLFLVEVVASKSVFVAHPGAIAE